MAATIVNNIMPEPTVVAHGTATIGSSGYYIYFTHDLGFVPDFVYVMGTYSYSSATHAAMYDSSKSTTNFTIQYRYYTTTVDMSSTYQSSSYGYLDSTKCSFPYYSYTWYTSDTIYWVAGKF